MPGKLTPAAPALPAAATLPQQPETALLAQYLGLGDPQRLQQRPHLELDQTGGPAIDLQQSGHPAAPIVAYLVKQGAPLDAAVNFARRLIPGGPQVVQQGAVPRGNDPAFSPEHEAAYNDLHARKGPKMDRITQMSMYKYLTRSGYTPAEARQKVQLHTLAAEHNPEALSYARAIDDAMFHGTPLPTATRDNPNSGPTYQWDAPHNPTSR